MINMINYFISELIVIMLIVLVLFIIFKIGKLILKLIFGIITNAILGLISIFALNYFFNLGIPIKIATLLICALFGLPGVGSLIILRLFNMIV